MSFHAFVLKDEYGKIKQFGDRLEQINGLVDWQKFRSIIAPLFMDGAQGGRPHTDEVVLTKCLVLQGLYGLSDEQLEFQSMDRISFRHFLGVDNKVPDFTTVWAFKERLQNAGIPDAIWNEFMRQIHSHGFAINKGVAQDASIIAARKSHAPQGERDNRSDQDGSWTVKGGKSTYGYKLHSKVELDNQFIMSMAKTTASVPDNQINLFNPDDEFANRDKGILGRRYQKALLMVRWRARRAAIPLQKSSAL